MEDHSKAVDEIPGPQTIVPTSSVVEVAVNLLSVIQVRGEKNPKQQNKNKQTNPPKPHTSEAKSFWLCLWRRLTDSWSIAAMGWLISELE